MRPGRLRKWFWDLNDPEYEPHFLLRVRVADGQFDRLKQVVRDAQPQSFQRYDGPLADPAEPGSEWDQADLWACDHNFPAYSRILSGELRANINIGHLLFVVAHELRIWRGYGGYRASAEDPFTLGEMQALEAVLGAPELRVVYWSIGYEYHAKREGKSAESLVAYLS